MKAIQMNETGAPSVLEHVDIERPTPKDGEVLIKVSSISVNNSDLVMRRGEMPSLPAFPIIPGGEYSGVIEAVADDVAGLQPGQSVVAFGNMFASAYAEYAVANAGSVVPIPEQLDLDVAAAVPIAYLMGHHMLHTVGRIERGQTILIYGAAGGVGSAATQLANHAGCTVVALASSPERATYAKQQGAKYTVLYKSEDLPKRVHEATDGRGIDLILNSAGGDTFARDFEVLAPLGQIIWFGLGDGPPRSNLSELLMANFMKSKGITAFTISSIIQDRPDLLRRSFDTLVHLILDGDITPHIHQRLPLAKAATAHTLFENSSVLGRIILNL